MKPGSGGGGFAAIWFGSEGFCGFCWLTDSTAGSRRAARAVGMACLAADAVGRAAIRHFQMPLKNSSQSLGSVVFDAGQAGGHLAGLHAVDDFRREQHQQLRPRWSVVDRAEGHAQVGHFADPWASRGWSPRLRVWISPAIANVWPGRSSTPVSDLAGIHRRDAAARCLRRRSR